MDFLELKELGIAGVSVGAVVYTVIKFLNHIKDQNVRSDKIHCQLDKSLKANTKASTQNYMLLKKINGDIAKVVRERKK